jgi:hypothetical protein
MMKRVEQWHGGQEWVNLIAEKKRVTVMRGRGKELISGL